MLTEPSFKPNDIVTVRVASGDEIVGKFIEESSDSYVINRPLGVMMAQQGLGLVPYLITAGPDITLRLDRNHVIAIVKTLNQIAKQYIKQTTNIIVP